MSEVNIADEEINLESTILKNLVTNDDYARRVLPFLDDGKFFSSDVEKKYFQTISNYFEKYNALPTFQALDVELDALQSIPQITYEGMKGLHKSIKLQGTDKEPTDWLLDKTEQFCKDKALYLALSEAIAISQGENASLSTTAIPEILSKALAVSFDTKLGHRYLKDAQQRYEFYHTAVSRLPFLLHTLNLITDGGCKRKTLNCVVAGTNVGKSIFLCDLAAQYLKQGFNVLYITMEMAEEELARRVDANLLNINIGEIDKVAKPLWNDAFQKLSSKFHGEIVFHEYPTASAHVGHFRFLMRELKQKQEFVPDVVIIDYLNICASAKFKTKTSMYDYNKSIAEELRGLAVETNVCMWTATQFNRNGVGNSDAEMTDTSESMGIVHTLDLMIALIVDENLMQMGQIMIKQLKTRLADISKHTKIMIGLDRSKMRFYDLANSSVSSTGSSAPQQQQSLPQKSSQGKKNGFSGIKT